MSALYGSWNGWSFKNSGTVLSPPIRLRSRGDTSFGWYRDDIPKLIIIYRGGRWVLVKNRAVRSISLVIKILWGWNPSGNMSFESIIKLLILRSLKWGEVNNNAVGWIMRHTDGQYGVHVETAVPKGEFRPTGNIYAWGQGRLPRRAGESSPLLPQLYRMQAIGKGGEKAWRESASHVP